jgi:hypothetical protein
LGVDETVEKLEESFPTPSVIHFAPLIALLSCKVPRRCQRIMEVLAVKLLLFKAHGTHRSISIHHAETIGTTSKSSSIFQTF